MQQELLVAAMLLAVQAGMGMAQAGSASDEARTAYRELAQTISKGLAEKDESALASHLDLEALLDRAVAGLSEEADLAGLRSGLQMSLDPAGDVLAHVQAGGSFTFLRLRDFAGEPRPVFRSLSISGELDYQYLMMELAEDRPKIVDIYSVRRGALLSEECRRDGLRRHAESVVAHLAAAEAEVVEHLDTIDAIEELTRKGKHGQALETWMRLPESLRADKRALVLRLRVAGNLDAKQLREAMNAFKRRFSDDPGADLLSIQPWVRLGSLEKAETSMKRVQKAVGKDPYLLSQRADLLLAHGNLAAARNYARQALKADSSQTGAYWTLMTVAQQKKDFKEMARILKVFKNDLGFAVNEAFLESPFYADFSASAAGRKFRKTLP